VLLLGENTRIRIFLNISFDCLFVVCFFAFTIFNFTIHVNTILNLSLTLARPCSRCANQLVTEMMKDPMWTHVNAADVSV
jgi:hypothetical protein